MTDFVHGTDLVLAPVFDLVDLVGLDDAYRFDAVLDWNLCIRLARCSHLDGVALVAFDLERYTLALDAVLESDAVLSDVEPDVVLDFVLDYLAFGLLARAVLVFVLVVDFALGYGFALLAVVLAFAFDLALELVVPVFGPVLGSDPVHEAVVPAFANLAVSALAVVLGFALGPEIDFDAEGFESASWFDGPQVLE